MVWDQLSINRPHLVYILLGGFTSCFMLVSLFIKEKLYIGEATVATIVGLIFGPHAANLINPLDWGNTDQITLEFSRIVLVVQCFAVGVELPKAYMERHWKSVTMLLVPVMTFGWLITSLFVWWMIEPLTWLESLCVAACVTATDPVLASSVVGKGKFAKRVPKHIRDLLSAESGCNDGMAFPFIYLAVNLIHYNLNARDVTFHWFCYTILYECIWGATYGVLVGYIARQAIKLAERKGVIDRESFLVFYFVLALFCAGSGSMLGMDDLLIGFAAGVGFSNDGWFTEKTEESHVSNVIDLLLNLTYFVYLGTIIPWDQFNSHMHGLDVWRLVVIAIFVIFFRRIPAMLMMKPLIPDIKTWREALFCGHFGPIGVGAIFVAILARAELETHSTTPLAVLPPPEDAEYVLIYTIWPITTFLVIASIVVHGSSIAVFTLGKRINTLTITLSYTQGNDQSSSWMNRLPRISSQGRSLSRMDSSDFEDEKLEMAPGQLPPIGIPKLHLRRQKEDEYAKPPNIKPMGRSRAKQRKKKQQSSSYGGPISDSAIMPARRSDPVLATQESNSDTLQEKSEDNSPEVLSPDQLERLKSGESDSDSELQRRESRLEERGKKETGRQDGDDAAVHIEAYEEGNQLIMEDAEGNVLETVDTAGKTDEQKAALIEETRRKLQKDTSGKYAKHKHIPHEGTTEGGNVQQGVQEAAEQPDKKFLDAFKGWKGFGKKDGHPDAPVDGPSKPAERKRGPAHAYQFGNTIIVEDEDGEVIKKYTLPRGEGEGDYNQRMREGMRRMSTWVGLGRGGGQAPPVQAEKPAQGDVQPVEEPQQGDQNTDPQGSKKEAKTRKRDNMEDMFNNDDGLRMVISRTDQYGLTGLHKPKPGERPDLVTTAGGRRLSTKDFIKQMQHLDQNRRMSAIDSSDAPEEVKDAARRGDMKYASTPAATAAQPGAKRAGTLPPHQEDTTDQAGDYFSPQPTSLSSKDTPLAEATTPQPRPEARRTETGESVSTIGEDQIPTHNVRSVVARHGQGMTAAERRRQQYSSSRIEEEEEDDASDDDDDNQETAAERRRRLRALGVKQPGDESSSDSDEDEAVPRAREAMAVQEPDSEGPTAGGPTTASPATKRNQPEQQQQPPPPPPPPAAAAPRMRVQWGGETRGHVRGEQDETGADESGQSQGAGKRIRGFFRGNK